MRRFVVVGCGRSGTKYTARLLTAAGVPCGHEAVFKAREPDLEFGRVVGDSSWYAVPYLHLLPPDVLILHQVREPGAVIRSWLQRQRFRRWAIEENALKHVAKRALRKPPSGNYATRRFIETHASEVFAERGAANRAARYWLVWNEMAERAGHSFEYRRYSVDQLDESLLSDLLTLIGGDPSQATNALNAVPRDTNSSKRPPFRVSTQLSPGVQAEVDAAAQRWGVG